MATEIIMLAANPEESALQRKQETAAGERKLLRWFELGLVLLVALGNIFLSSFSRFAVVPVRTGWSLNMYWTAMLVQELIALLLLGYVLARRNLRIQDLGLCLSSRELAPGVLVTAASYAAYKLAYLGLTRLHWVLFGSAAHGQSLHALFGYTTVMLVVFSLVNPFFEELIVRAYLMTELKSLTGSWMVAALVSTAVQTSYHLYYGWTLALALACQFLVFSIYYSRTRRATPLVLAHAAFDLVGVVHLI